MPDFSRDGADGALPEDHDAWQWGVVYTVRSDMHAQLEQGREYFTMAMIRRRIGEGHNLGDYAELYRHASAVAESRSAELMRGHKSVRTWIAGQGWGSFGETRRFGYAAVRLGLLHPLEGQAVPEGLAAPSPGELGEDRVPAAVDAAQPGEVYNAFDFRDPMQPLTTICLFSYGEIVPLHRGLTFEPFIERAEKLAKGYRDLIDAGAASQPLNIVRREWMWATSPDVAVVHIYFDTRRD